MKFLGYESVNAKIGPRSRVQIWRDIKNDRFPLPVLNGGRKAWVDYEITSYQRWRLAVRDGETTIERWSGWWSADRQRAEEEAA
jgi:predicted DNA-binding transcriptional regulator AlpA